MKYKNRYGDTIEATKLDDNHYKITSMLELCTIRTGKNNNNLDFIDFVGGGPMISVKDDLGDWFNELKGKIVKSIKFDKGVIIEV
jgi:hypothetical protein